MTAKYANLIKFFINCSLSTDKLFKFFVAHCNGRNEFEFYNQ